MTTSFTHRPTILAAAVATSLLACGQALAQSPAKTQIQPPVQTPTAADATTLPPVRARAAAELQGKDAVQATTTRIGKGLQDVRDVPQSVTVVTEKLLDDRNLDTVKDALHNTAGITFQAAEGGEEDIRLRGFPLQATGDVFVDGMRDPAFYDRDTFWLDRLELLRGSASMLFGRGSSGGAVNQVTKVPRLLNENQVDVTVGSHGYLRTAGDFNLRLGASTALRLGAMGTVADNNGSGASVDKRGVAATLRTGIGERHEWSAQVYVLQNDNGMNYGIPWIRPSTTSTSDQTTLTPVSPTRYYGLASDRLGGSAGTLDLSHTWRLARGHELTTKLRKGDYKRDQRAGAIRYGNTGLQPGGIAASLATFGANTVLTRGTHLKVQDLQTLLLQSDYSGQFKALGFKHQVQAGFDLADENKQVYSDSPNLNGATRAAFYSQLGLTKPTTTIGTPNDGAAVDENRRQFFQTSAYGSQAKGIYLQDLVQVLDHWKLLLGLRHDWLTGHYATQAYTYAGTTGNHGYQHFAAGTSTGYRMKISETSKRLGVLFQPSERLSFHVSAATSFNTSGDAYSLSAANVDIPPEESINLELGARIDSASGDFTTRVALFRSTKLHERNTDPLVNLVTLSGKRHTAGLEIDLTGRLTPQWEVFGSYMWMPVAKIDIGVAGAEGQGTRPSLTPRHSGTIWTTYQVNRQWRVGAGLNARSSQTPNRNPGWTAPRFVTGDLMAELQLMPDKMSFKTNLSNVTNKLYADQLYTGHYIPGAGRLLQLTGSYKF